MENPNRTNIRYLFGVGVRKVQEQENPDRRDPRIVIRWSFASALEGKKSKVWPKFYPGLSYTTGIIIIPFRYFIPVVLWLTKRERIIMNMTVFRVGS